PAIGALVRRVRQTAVDLAGVISPRSKIGRAALPGGDTGIEQLKALVATIAVFALVSYLAYQLYDLRPPYPGMMPPQRSILGTVVAADGCWSSALGGIWKPDDDLKAVFDSTFEQIAYGTFPWGILAPLAMAWLLRSSTPGHRQLGGLTLAWTAAAWIAGEAFSRKVGFTIWAGFPPMAIAIGAWFDAILTERRAQATAIPAGPTLLVGLFVALGALDLGKDLQSFTERLTSLLVGSDAIAFATKSRLLLIPTRAWILIIGVLIAFSFAIAMMVWRPGEDARAARYRKLATRAAAVSIACTIVMAAFWSFVWHPHLAVNYSSKAMFDQVHDLKQQGDQLVVMGDMGDAPTSYAGKDHEKVETREQIVAALGRTNRVFAITPQTELCTFHREMRKPYFVLDDRNLRSILLSNRVDGAIDKNPLRTSILHTEPTGITTRPKVDIIWDKKIQLLGWSIPEVVDRGAKFEVKMFYKILNPVTSAWTSLMHFDGGARFNGDHKPIADRCPTSTWMPGDYIIDTHTVTAGGTSFSRGKYELWVGFFTGSNPNWRNMPVSAPSTGSAMRDTVDRVKITSIVLD
nr:hypothetical protein [Deltaproteobacteria bacterium]